MSLIFKLLGGLNPLVAVERVVDWLQPTHLLRTRERLHIVLLLLLPRLLVFAVCRLVKALLAKPVFLFFGRRSRIPLLACGIPT